MFSYSPSGEAGDPEEVEYPAGQTMWRGLGVTKTTLDALAGKARSLGSSNAAK